MTEWIVRAVVNALGLTVSAWLFAGITVTGSTDERRLITLVVVALIFGLVNEFVRPIVAFLSFPLYILSLGLMFFVVNALMLMLTSWVSGVFDVGFHVEGFWTAVGGALVITVVSWVVGLAFPPKDDWR